MRGKENRRRWLVGTGLVLLLLFSLALPVLAFEGRSGETVIIEADEVIEDDLYVGANQFILNGTVRGDLFAAGASVEINGTVEGDFFGAAQSVIVNGTVGDDARIAGYALSVAGQVADDLIAAGFSLDNDGESAVGGDLLFAGYQAILDGEVGGTADVGGGAVRISGRIGGNANVDVGGTEPGARPPSFVFPGMPAVPSVPTGLTITDSAEISGDLNYTANERVQVPSGVVAGETNFSRYVAPEDERAPEAPGPSLALRIGKWFLKQIRRFTTLLLVGLLMMWIVPNWTRRLADLIRTKPLPSLGWGVVFIAVFAVVMLTLLTITIILAVVFGIVTLGELAKRFIALGGLVMGSLGFGFSITWAYVTKIAMSLLLGQLIFSLFHSNAAENRWWSMLLGVVIFAAITAIPVLGWLATLATVLLGLGAIWLWGQQWLASRRETAA